MSRPQIISNDEILTVAREAWLVEPTLPTSAIAQRLGISEATLFKRFGTKARLMGEAFALHEVPPYQALLERGPDDRPILAQLHELARHFDTYFIAMVPRIAALHDAGVAHPHGGAHEDGRSPLLATYQGLHDWFATAREQGRIRDIEPHLAAVSLLSLMQSRIFWRLSLRFDGPIPELWRGTVDRLQDDAVLHGLIETFWRGMAPASEDLARTARTA